MDKFPKKHTKHFIKTPKSYFTMIQKPLDALNLLKGQEVTIVLKTGREIVGKLEAYDVNTNVAVNIDGNSVSIQGHLITGIFK